MYILWGLYRGYIGILEKKMETTISGYAIVKAYTFKPFSDDTPQNPGGRDVRVDAKEGCCC